MITTSTRHIALLQVKPVFRRIALSSVTLALLQSPLCLSAQQQLHITPGGHLVMNGQAQLVMNNIAFNNDGDFIADSSNVRFIGETGALTNSIMGNTITSFNHLTLHTDPVSGVFLRQDLMVTGNLGMEAGHLMLNGHEVTLSGAGQILGESSASYIDDISMGTGSVSITRKLFAPRAVNPGNIGIGITSNANLGSTTIIRRFDQETLGMGGGTGIARWFSITPTYNSGLNATVRVHYLDHELGNNTAGMLDVWTGSDIMATWFDAGRSSSDLIQHWVQLDGIDHFNRVTLGNIDNDPILPITTVKTRVYPNPTHDQLVLTLTSLQEDDAVINLYDQGGHLLQHRMVHLNVGSNTLTWSLSAYPAGIYYLVPGKGASQKFKVIKQ